MLGVDETAQVSVVDTAGMRHLGARRIRAWSESPLSSRTGLPISALGGF